MIPLLFLGAAAVGFGLALSTKSPRNTQRYILRDRGRQVHCGITDRSLPVREREHQRKKGLPNARATPIGKRVTREAGKRWERDMGCSPHKPRGQR